MAKKKKGILLFECPSCGNELMNSDCNCITCHWCQTRIVPEGYRNEKQHAQIYSESDRYKNYLRRKNEKRKE